MECIGVVRAVKLVDSDRKYRHIVCRCRVILKMRQPGAGFLSSVFMWSM